MKFTRHVQSFVCLWFAIDFMIRGYRQEQFGNNGMALACFAAAFLSLVLRELVLYLTKE